MEFHTYDFHQNFEKDDPFKVWVTDGLYVIHYKGISAETSISGQKSFKQDVTLGTAKYLYLMIPTTVPCSGNLDFSGKIRISQMSGITATLGLEVIFPPSTHSGIIPIDRINHPSDSWVLQTADLVKRGRDAASRVLNRHAGGANVDDTGIMIDKVALLLFSEQGGRITVYVDDLSIRGKTSEREAYEA